MDKASMMPKERETSNYSEYIKNFKKLGGGKPLPLLVLPAITASLGARNASAR
jgi:hypothetical protein